MNKALAVRGAYGDQALLGAKRIDCFSNARPVAGTIIVDDDDSPVSKPWIEERKTIGDGLLEIGIEIYEREGIRDDSRGIGEKSLMELDRIVVGEILAHTLDAGIRKELWFARQAFKRIEKMNALACSGEHLGKEFCSASPIYPDLRNRTRKLARTECVLIEHVGSMLLYERVRLNVTV